jgi:mannitol-1-/sugar-/sorbitol-6-phosphatase
MQTFLCSAVLFDLDGVLVDSTTAVDRVWRLWARSHGVDEEKVIAVAHGVRTLEVIRAVAPHLDAQVEAQRLENREGAERDGVVVMAGAAELVESVPEGRWGVVTSGTRDLAAARLRWAGIPVPNVMISADDVVNGKPDPEPYLKGAERLGFAPRDCLVIEDAPAGIQSAHAAGMKVIGMASTFLPPMLKSADAVVEKLALIRVNLDGAGKLAVRVSPQ